MSLSDDLDCHRTARTTWTKELQCDKTLPFKSAIETCAWKRRQAGRSAPARDEGVVLHRLIILVALLGRYRRPRFGIRVLLRQRRPPPPLCGLAIRHRLWVFRLGLGLVALGRPRRRGDRARQVQDGLRQALGPLGGALRQLRRGRIIDERDPARGLLRRRLFFRVPGGSSCSP